MPVNQFSYTKILPFFPGETSPCYLVVICIIREAVPTSFIVVCVHGKIYINIKFAILTIKCILQEHYTLFNTVQLSISISQTFIFANY